MYGVLDLSLTLSKELVVRFENKTRLLVVDGNVEGHQTSKQEIFVY